MLTIREYLKLFIYPYKYKQMKAFAYLLIFSISAVVSPLVVQQIIDVGIVAKTPGKLMIYIGMLLTNGMIMMVFYYLNSISYFKIGQNFEYDLKKIIIQNLSNCNKIFFDNNKVVEILYIIQNEISDLKMTGVKLFSGFVVNIIKLIAFLFILLYCSSEITLIYLLLVLLIMFVQKKVVKLVKIRYRKFNDCNAAVYNRLHEFIKNIEAITFLERSKYFTHKFDKIQKESFREEFNYYRFNMLSQLLVVMINVFGYLIVFGVGGMLVIANKMTIGILFVIYTYIQRLHETLNSVSNCYVQFSKMKANYEKIYKLISVKEIISEGEKELETIVSINFENLFLKLGDTLLFENFNYNILRGEKIAILGNNGTGKTTLIRILMRFLYADSGQVLVNGKQIESYKLTGYRNKIMALSQEPLVINASIRENLTFDEKINDDYLYDVLKQVMLLDDIENMEEGIETIVGEKGIALSSGQRQKLALARIFIFYPEVLILDEPTSALDLEAEEKICERIFNRYEDRTVIFISHREEIVKYATKKIDLNEKICFPVG